MVIEFLAVGRQRHGLLAGTAVALSLACAPQAWAQVAPTSDAAAPVAAKAAPAARSDSSIQLEDIVVTAQRREESLQSVPIAITAITAGALQANRVTSIQDLNGLAPGFTVRPSAGGIALPSFTMRGITSYGVVPGSDKEISVYVDGVYIGSPRGSSFDLPDIERIEVLRGPQGTLFGRNATAGAISVTTRNPLGIMSAKQDFTIGNYNQRRIRTTVDLPSWGPFSAYGSYVYDARDGDIKNLGAGTITDRTGPDTRTGVSTSPKTLGSKNSEQWFAAVKFEPSDTFNMTYKFDHETNDFSPGGVAPVAYIANAPLIGPFLTALLSSQPTPVVFDTSVKRPDAVNNAFAIEGHQRTTGHTLTANFRASDSLVFKNIASYRTSFINSAQNLDGYGGLVFTPQALVPYATFAAFSRAPALALAPAATQAAVIGQFARALAPLIGGRFCVICNNSQSSGKQYSEELQGTYTSSLLTLTAGALYFHQEDTAGGPAGMANNFNFTPLSIDGRLPLGNEATTYTKGTSIAAYAQAEVHLNSRLDLVAGGRLTHDDKSGTYVSGGTYIPGPNGFTDGTFTGQSLVSFKYKKTKPTYSVGANYQITRDILVYSKYATAFVSGGSTGNLGYGPETVGSAEAGIKADLFDRHVRTNLAVYTAKYKNIQSAQSGTNAGHPELSTVIIPLGDERASGFEFEGTVLPLNGLSLGGSVSYTHIKFGPINPVILAGNGGTRYNTYVGNPKWTAGLNGQYEIDFANEMKLVLRGDATWQSKRENDRNPDRLATVPAYAPLDTTPSYWIVNSRLALRNIQLGAVKAELAGWVRNLTQTKVALYPLQLGVTEATDFVPARTYGVDLQFRF